MPGRAGALVVPVILAGLLCACSSEPPGITVYAAASIANAVEEAARVYGDSIGISIQTRSGASGTLASLIGEGAPADIFVSANALWIDHLYERGILLPGSARILAWNRLAAVVPVGSGKPPPSRPVELVGLERIAIGDPSTVPAGQYAKQALLQYGIWDVLEAQLMLAQDARAVLALAERGEVDAALVYESDAKASERVRLGFIFPDRSHDPVAYPGALVRASRRREEARKFLQFLSGPEGRAIFIAHGLGGS